MVLLKKPISIIEDIIKNDYYNEEYFENFFINESFELLEKYINDFGKTVENKESRNLLQKILIGFFKIQIILSFSNKD